jgi:hypothetical protein
MDVVQQGRKEKKQKLLVELTELMVEEQVEEGVYLETPHYSVIELQAMTLGRELSRQAQERASREVAAGCKSQVACPECQSLCTVEVQRRKVISLDGPVEILENVANCRSCRRSFFPSACENGPG